LKWTVLIGIVVIFALLLFAFNGSKPGEKVNLIGEGTPSNPNSVQYLIENDMVLQIYIASGEGKILKIGSDVKEFPKNSDYYFTYSTGSELEILIGWIDAHNADVAINNPTGTRAQITYNSEIIRQSWLEANWPLLLMIVLAIGLCFVMLRGVMGANSKSMNFGRTKTTPAQNVKVRFSDVAGIDEEREELQEVVEFLKNPQKFTELGAKIPKGILLVGPPGTGKTLLAKAIAGESNVPFFSISGSDFVEMFVGVGASRVRDLFDQAKRHAPCLVFIDEIDAVGRQRGAGLGGGNDEREQTLNQLLVQMDGFEGNEGVIVIAATNRSDVLDPALLRPGRFDRQIYVYPPDVRGREKIFEVHSKNKPLDKDVNFKTLSRITAGFTGADIENVLNEAAIIAAKQEHKKITMKDVTEGINKVIMGPQKKSRVVTDNDRRITAYHEAGHAILQKVLTYCNSVQEVSIIPRGGAGGYTYSRPDNDDVYMSKNKLLDEICSFYGGRAAEEITVGDILTGAANDIERATALARKMVVEWGMSDLGAINYHSASGEVFIGRSYQTQVDYSESKAAEIDAEVAKILKDCYDRAKTMLKENLHKLNTMAELLLAKETIYSEEVELVMQGKTKDEIIKVMEENEARNKARVELERAEIELDKVQKEQAVRLRSAEALFKAEVIDAREMAKTREEANKIIAAAKEKYENLKNKEDAAKENSTAKTVKKPTDETAVKPAKTVTKKSAENGTNVRLKAATKGSKQPKTAIEDKKEETKPDDGDKSK
jgi:cell division protease FtsH